MSVSPPFARTRPLTPESPPPSSMGPPAESAPGMVLPGLLVIAVALALTLADGAFAGTAWYPLALFVLALLVIALYAAPPPRRQRSRAFSAALAAFGGLTAWTFASIAWADAPGDAWQAANRTLLYLLAFAVVGLRPWPPRMAQLALGMIGFGIALIGVGVLTVGAAGSPADVFIEGRIGAPTGYINATANLWLIGVCPALGLCLARDLPWPVRSAGLAAAVLLLGLALLAQSRGAGLAFAIAAIVFVALHPRRWPAIAALAALGGLLTLAWDPLVELRLATTTTDLGDGLDRARSALGLVTGGAFVVAAAAILSGRLFFGGEAPRGLRRGGNWLLMGASAAAVVAGLVVAAGSTGWLDERWDDFRSGDYETNGQTRFSGELGSGRYDFYRVAVEQFRAQPVLGTGAENFQAPYLLERRTLEAPRYAHSLLFETLAGLGAVGIVLLGAFLLAAIAGIVIVRRRVAPGTAGIVAAGAGGFVVWFSHANADWLWQFPALTVLSLALLAVAMRVRDRRVIAGNGDGDASLPMAGRVALAVGALGAVASLVLAGGAARYEQSATDALPERPGLALQRLERAADLDPLSADPLVIRAVVARRLDRPAIARSALREAIEREPRNWYAHFEVALLNAVSGDRPSALARLDRAIALNPHQPVLLDTRKAIQAGRRLDPEQAVSRLNQQVTQRAAPTGSP